ncbi:uncharacterized protein LOC110868925 isoform X2 [Helianthus annuus]|uniref:uncharacterized protein LOC110868925 isoform X2 n=1 Tax=Helianthus annuus TaxID=4232 RepID=UPI0016532AE2|nr:uncharacterized protein LOC110868925 isoform X2 [Helianthus annuus]
MHSLTKKLSARVLQSGRFVMWKPKDYLLLYACWNPLQARNNYRVQIPLLKFFDENLPNLTVSRTDKNGVIEVKWNDKDGDVYMNTADGGNMISYFLQHMSTTKSDFDFDFLSKAGKTSFIRADDLQMKDFVLPKPSGTHSLGIRDFMQTPGVCCIAARFISVCLCYT